MIIAKIPPVGWGTDLAAIAPRFLYRQGPLLIEFLRPTPQQSCGVPGDLLSPTHKSQEAGTEAIRQEGLLDRGQPEKAAYKSPHETVSSALGMSE